MLRGPALFQVQSFLPSQALPQDGKYLFHFSTSPFKKPFRHKSSEWKSIHVLSFQKRQNKTKQTVCKGQSKSWFKFGPTTRQLGLRWKY